MKQRLLLFLVLLIVVLALFFYFVPQGRSLAGRIFGLSSSAADLVVTTNVKSAFALSKRLSAYGIAVETADGVVKLSGQVPTEVDKELAANVAKDVPNVKSVDNQLQVQPGLKPSEASVREGMRITDLEIRAEFNEKLAASQALQGHTIQANVLDRIVTLTGQVESPAQKVGAEQLARSVANVVDVVNNLSCLNPGAAQNETPDSLNRPRRIKTSPTASYSPSLKRENFVDMGSIKIAGRENSVTLSGNVSSKAEKALAERIVRDVDGVKSVSNQLTVAAAK